MGVRQGDGREHVLRVRLRKPDDREGNVHIHLRPERRADVIRVFRADVLPVRFCGHIRLSNVVAQYDSTGTRQARYTQGPGVDQPLEQLRSGSYYTYQKDGLGSTSKITDASQSTVDAYSYSRWGDTTTSGSLANPFQYTGREADSSSSLYHYRSRVYDPGSRSFAQRDPGGMATGTNGYGYARGNPVTMVDPSGRDPPGAYAAQQSVPRWMQWDRIVHDLIAIQLILAFLGLYYQSATLVTWAAYLAFGSALLVHTIS